MKTINLRYCYPYYTGDVFVEVSDEVAEALLLMRREENNRTRKIWYHKAYYSLDCEDGIENCAFDFTAKSAVGAAAYRSGTKMTNEWDGCVCVQSVSYSLLCRWFRVAVLPLDHQLETALYHWLESRRRGECGTLFRPGSNQAKYCRECAARVRRRKEAER